MARLGRAFPAKPTVGRPRPAGPTPPAGPVRRNLLDRLLLAATRFPVVTLTGPRQSGKTTLCKAAFAAKPYANLEAPDVREFARHDPRGFLAQFPEGGVLDEIQHAPDLLSYVQDIVDRRPRVGQFVLTGSQHFGLLDRVTQSLAGRTAVLHLLPLGLDEVRRFPSPPPSLFDTLLCGGYPPVHDRGIPPHDWFTGYVATYLERDVRQVLNVGDLQAFQTFVGLCAGRAGQVLNLSALGSDAGVSHNTARSWLSVLEASFIVFRLPPLQRTFRKRLTKSPKLYFHDSGLLCYLLGLRAANDLGAHPLRGPIFESWVVSEIAKARVHRGLRPDLFFYRDQHGDEVDLVLELGNRLVAVEIKSAQTVAGDFFAGLDRFADLAVRQRLPLPQRVLVYGGDAAQRRTRATVVPWSAVPSYAWT
jgi:uncharacterized protein